MDIEELLERGLKELGHVPETDIVRSFMTYLSELRRWNKTYSLTSIRKDEDIIIRHFLDSLLFLKVIPEHTGSIADVGSGAGFPGIPIKIMRPEIEMYLIESSRKKSAYLRHVKRQLGLKKTNIIEKRIEKVKVERELPLPADVAVTRALFSIKDFLKKASHIVRDGGILILNKGPRLKEEINLLKDEDIEYEIIPLSLPLSDIKRHIVVASL